MDGRNPRLWPYSPASSPVALPETDVLHTPEATWTLTPPGSTDNGTLDLEALRTWAAGYTDAQGVMLSDLLATKGAAPLEQRWPLLLLGELANPYRLAALRCEVAPILRVRLSDLCRTWADGQDARHIQPGLHHVTLARSPGWWEVAHLGLFTRPEMKRLTMWLGEERPGVWKPVRPAEGSLHVETGALEHPGRDDIQWNGAEERVERPAPAPTGTARKATSRQSVGRAAPAQHRVVNAPAQNAPPNYRRRRLRGDPFAVVQGSSQISICLIGRLYRAPL